ncbi:MAG: hypothetical protein ACR652_09600 [Methylocystis sp.]|uniref:hypothetical protein n=1 Tax=Methylocystis sp. TaxID=1911079 RepID=UPI003DA6A6AD
MRRALAALCMIVLFAAAPPAEARGDLRRLANACIVKAGPDLMYFTAYLPAESHRRFCGDIPATGAAIFVLDYGQPEMREMSADFRIIRDPGGRDEDDEADAARLQAETVAYLPPRRYPAGTLSFQHIFPVAGDFVGIVTLDGPNGEHWVSRFPFSVGRIYSVRAPWLLLAAAAALALMLLLWGKDESAKGK